MVVRRLYDISPDGLMNNHLFLLQLDYTHDPIADFINAVQSDVIAFGSQRR